jgi:hypothetical protein
MPNICYEALSSQALRASFNFAGDYVNSRSPLVIFIIPFCNYPLKILVKRAPMPGSKAFIPPMPSIIASMNYKTLAKVSFNPIKKSSFIKSL